MIRPRKVGKHAFKIDCEATAKRRPPFEHPRSFMSVDQHEILFGGDKAARRAQVYEKSHGRCAFAGTLQASRYCKGWVMFSTGEWHHLNANGHRNRCDCLDNGVFICGPCHRHQHVRPMWTRKQEAQEQFNRLYPEEK